MKKTIVINGGKIVELLAELDSTQDELAATSGVSVRTIRRLQEPATPCRTATLEKLIKGFNKISRDRFGIRARKWTVEDFLAQRKPVAPAGTSTTPADAAGNGSPEPPKVTTPDHLASSGSQLKTRTRTIVLGITAVALLVIAVAIGTKAPTRQSEPDPRPMDVAENGRLDEAAKRMRQGSEHLSWTEVQEALRAFERAYEIRLELLGENAVETLESQRQIAAAHHWLANFEKAERMQRELLERLQDRKYPALTYGVMSDLARTLDDQGNPNDSLQWVAKDRLISLEGPRSPGALVARHNAITQAFHLKTEAVESELLDLVADMKTTLGDSHPHTIVSLMSLGVFYSTIGDAGKATVSLNQASELAEEHLGPDNLWTLKILANLAGVRKGSVNDVRELAGPFADSFQRVQARMPSDHPTMLRLGQVLAAVHWKTGANALGIELMSEVVDGTERRFGPDHDLTWQRRHWLAIHYKQAQRVEEAIPILQRVRDYYQQAENAKQVAKLDVDIMSCRTLQAFGFLGIGRERRKALSAVGNSVVSELSELPDRNDEQTEK